MAAPARDGDRWLNWDELADALVPYAADMGFTHIELLPVTEHPFDGSWGYQTLGLYAPTSRFGAPDGLSRASSTRCHAAGLGVMLDWVPAHFPDRRTRPGAIRRHARCTNTPTRAKASTSDWNTLIYNFGRTEVRNFLVGNALYWIERYGVDGLRVDAVASMLYRDYSRPAGEWVPNVHGGRENLEAIALPEAHATKSSARECPGAVTWPRSRPRSPASARPPTPAAWASTTSGTWAGCTTRCATWRETRSTAAGTTTS